MSTAIPSTTSELNSMTTSEAINNKNTSTSYTILNHSTMQHSEPLPSAPEVLLHVGDGIFLQTKMCQVTAGIAVWVALFVSKR